jgi:hypothetical protein
MICVEEPDEKVPSGKNVLFQKGEANMKKAMIFTVMAVALMAMTAGAQTTLTPVYQVKVGDNNPAWFANDNTTRSGCLNTASTESNGVSVVIADRDSVFGNLVRVCSATDGAYVRDLPGGFSGGLFVLNSVVAADDGVIYVANLTTDGNNAKLYSIADDSTTAATTELGTFTATNRYGDTINVTVSGNNRTVYVTGNNAASLVVAWVSTDGGSSWTPSEVGPTRAALGVAGDTPGGSIFLKTPSEEIIEYNQTGTELNQITAGVVGAATGSTTGLDYADIGGQEWIALTSYDPGSQFIAQVFNITNRGAVTLGFDTPAVTDVTNANANGTSSVSLAEVGGLVTVFNLATNNIYALYEDTSHVEDWELF